MRAWMCLSPRGQHLHICCCKIGRGNRGMASAHKRKVRARTFRLMLLPTYLGRKERCCCVRLNGIPLDNTLSPSLDGKNYINQ